MQKSSTTEPREYRRTGIPPSPRSSFVPPIRVLYFMKRRILIAGSALTSAYRSISFILAWMRESHHGPFFITVLWGKLFAVRLAALEVRIFSSQ